MDDKKTQLVRRDLFRKIRETFGKVPFSENALAAYYCAMDPETPKRVKAILIGALAYFITPIDAIPDFILGLGFTDDISVFWFAWRSVSDHITATHKYKAKEFLIKEQSRHTDLPSD